MFQHHQPKTMSPAEALDITRDAQYFEYTSSANPLGAKLISKVPYHQFPAALYADGASRIVPLDLSKELGCTGPATGPSLCAHFVRLLAGDRIDLTTETTSQVFYVISGSGRATQAGMDLPFAEGDFFSLPGGSPAALTGMDDAALYYVNDAPLLRYLGVRADQPRFTPTLYPAARAKAELAAVIADDRASQRNRISILLGNTHFPQTRTVTHVLWAMFGMVAPHSEQKPHRHQSIALDFIADCAPGCYSLVGTAIDDEGRIIQPQRVDWAPGMAFVTPPGYWHAHFNESDQIAHVIPIQDAGLQTYLRTLDIRFSH